MRSLTPLARRAWIGFAGLLLGATLSACASTQAVAPWQKGNLARPEMSFEWDKLDKIGRAHV